MTSAKIKETVRARDGYACVRCGMTAAEHRKKYGRTLEVHRVSPGSEYSAAPGVCETLCVDCHADEPKSLGASHSLMSCLSRENRNRLRTIKVLRAEMSEDFDPVAFVNTLIREPVAIMHRETCDAFCALHAERVAKESA